MADRYDFFFRQPVTELELDNAFDKLEQADLNILVDLGLYGVFSGLTVAQAASPNLTVVVALGSGYDQLGRRIRVPSNQTVSVATDSNGVTTDVATPGNEKWVSLVAQFDRTLSVPRVDGNSVTVQYQRFEGYKWSIVQGAEAAIGAAVRPTLPTDGILLADINRVNAQTQILNASISTTRRQDAIVVAGSPLAIQRGLIEDAFSDVVGRYNNHANGTGDVHPATAVNYAGGGSWAGGSGPTNPATTVEAQLDKIIADLSALGSGSSGTDRIGSAGIVGASGTIAAGTTFSQLTALKSAQNIEYAGGAAWLNGTTNPATTVEAQLDKLITDLSATGGGGANGASRIGVSAFGSWLGGRANNTTTSVFTTIQKIIDDLGVNNDVNDDGAERIGFTPSGSIAANNVGGAIRELDTEKAALAGATFVGTTIVPQVITSGFLDIGVIAAGTQLTHGTSLVLCQPGGSNASNFNIAMPGAPASGNPIIDFIFHSFTGTTRRVWITNTANIGTNPPTDYFCYWEGSTSNARLSMRWDGTRWRVFSHITMTGVTGGGALAD